MVCTTAAGLITAGTSDRHLACVVTIPDCLFLLSVDVAVMGWIRITKAIRSVFQWLPDHQGAHIDY